MQSKISTTQLDLFNESALPEAVTLHADRPGFFPCWSNLWGLQGNDPTGWPCCRRYWPRSIRTSTRTCPRRRSSVRIAAWSISGTCHCATWIWTPIAPSMRQGTPRGCPWPSVNTWTTQGFPRRRWWSTRAGACT